MNLHTITDLLNGVVREYVEQVGEHEDPDTVRTSTYEERIEDFRLYLSHRRKGE